MKSQHDLSQYEDTFDKIRVERAAAIEHTVIARKHSAERRRLMESLIAEGISQAEIGRELGVSRQAIQKMLAC